MLNFAKISRQMKEFSIKALDFARSVCIAAICYSGPILAMPTNVQLLGEKRRCAKFQIDISKTKAFVCVYTDRQMDLVKLTQGLRRFALSVKNFVINLIYTVQGIKICLQAAFIWWISLLILLYTHTYIHSFRALACEPTMIILNP